MINDIIIRQQVIFYDLPIFYITYTKCWKCKYFKYSLRKIYILYTSLALCFILNATQHLYLTIYKYKFVSFAWKKKKVETMFFNYY